MSERTSLSSHHHELLLSLAYLGGLTYALILRLLPCYSGRTLERDLADLRRLGDVEKHPLYRSGPKGRPVKVCDVWALTDKGHAYIAAKESDRYPLKPAKLRHRRVLAHDLLVTKAVVALVELARPDDLSGLFIQLETRLNPGQRRPVPDAVVIMQLGGGFDRRDIVPWTRDPAIADEQRQRYAIEADNETETLSVIAGKAVAYRTAFRDPEWRAWWTAQFGPLPVVVWAVGNQAGSRQQALHRLQAIRTAWDPVWPDARWMGATEQDLERNYWLAHFGGVSGWGSILSLQQAAPKPAPERTAGATPGAAAATNIGAGTVLTRTATQPAPAPVSTGASTPRQVPTPAPGQAPAAAGGATSVVTPTRVPAPPAPPAGVYPSSSTAIVPSGGGAAALGVTPSGSNTPARDVVIRLPPARELPPPVPTYPVRETSWLDWLLEEIFSPVWIFEALNWLADMVPPAVDWLVCRVCLSPLRLIFQILRVPLWLLSMPFRLLSTYDEVEWLAYEVGHVLAILALLACLTGGVFVLYREGVVPVLEAGAGQTTAPAAPAPVAPPPGAQPQVPDPPAGIDQAPTAEPAGCGTARVSSDALNLRATPLGRIVAVLYSNQAVVLLCEAEQLGASRWVRVRAGAHAGWVNARFLRATGTGG